MLRAAKMNVGVNYDQRQTQNYPKNLLGLKGQTNHWATVKTPLASAKWGLSPF